MNTNLADFGLRERLILVQLLGAWHNNGLPEDFGTSGVVPGFDQYTGDVYLTNEDGELCTLAGDGLESFYISPWASKSGLFSDLIEDYDDMHLEDQQWLRGIAKTLRRDSDEDMPWNKETDEE
jgi:hypothetical protein